MKHSKERALEAHKAGREDVFELLEEALQVDPSDSELLVAHAAQSALDKQDNPFSRLEAKLSASPDWVEGHRALAQLKSEFGFDEPLATIESALSELPDNPRLWMAYLGLLAGGERHAEAADHAAALCKRIGPVPGLRLLEARYAGLAGEHERAASILTDLPSETPQLAYEFARNALRQSDLKAASGAIENALAEAPEDMGAIALSELIWRASGDPRHEDLILGSKLIARADLELRTDQLAAVSSTIEKLHKTVAAPLGQSVKGGTQTRGDLRSRREPEIAVLFSRIEEALGVYGRNLAESPSDHPLHALSTRKPSIAASWSILLQGGGHHVSHLHDGGLVSSALHLLVPDNATESEGLLELGRPPADIAINLPPLKSFAPEPGKLILFPSFLYHGTTPFGAGKRLTVAFDAA